MNGRSGKLPPRLNVAGATASAGSVNTSDSELEAEVVRGSKVKLTDADLEFIAEIGSGSGGCVSLCRYKGKNSILARKVAVVDESARPRAERKLLRELKILRLCKSPYIVEFYGAFAFEGEISICMEYMDLGSLENVYKVVGPFREDIIAHITVAVLNGLVYLFNLNRIVHRDIKPSNILINTKGEVKLADFGVAKELVNSVAATFTGTQGYLAPERINGRCEHSIESDIWSLGIALMELALARFPLPPDGNPFSSPIEMLNYIETEPSPTLPPGRFSTEFNSFVNACLMKDVEARPKPEQLMVCLKYFRSPSHVNAQLFRSTLSANK
ncbi:kinase-like domain-containing protein [Cladochytrium replicatum]|nr:kinase-like domain-containing protein [Cladochytrium replicatum]